jgi:hypothetical protein
MCLSNLHIGGKKRGRCDEKRKYLASQKIRLYYSNVYQVIWWGKKKRTRR